MGTYKAAYLTLIREKFERAKIDIYSVQSEDGKISYRNRITLYQLNWRNFVQKI
ncbi:hypothetical protein [Rhodohalobacter sp.]|uniref:hypothetical protein n=1 Tax=Rhodohalobacter sp. TaxID=1974210 RepID=UPI002ACEC1DA|nr:hypothetical protein [Rhodohalobacter sp.]MDZ7758061.1 hypothetical protein [Rhodohalobacter sp.]